MQVESQDFYLAVYLCLNGLDIKEMRPFGNRTMFVFEDNTASKFVVYGWKMNFWGIRSQKNAIFSGKILCRSSQGMS